MRPLSRASGLKSRQAKAYMQPTLQGPHHLACGRGGAARQHSAVVSGGCTGGAGSMAAGAGVEGPENCCHALTVKSITPAALVAARSGGGARRHRGSARDQVGKGAAHGGSPWSAQLQRSKRRESTGGRDSRLTEPAPAAHRLAVSSVRTCELFQRSLVVFVAHELHHPRSGCGGAECAFGAGLRQKCQLRMSGPWLRAACEPHRRWKAHAGTPLAAPDRRGTPDASARTAE